jgi:tRNA pseudouridine55 synthase
LKMDGKPLYEYAREGKPLPRPIEKRKVTISELEVTSWLGGDHDFRWPDKKFTEEEQKALEKTLKSVESNAQVVDEPDPLVMETKVTASEPAPEGQQSSDDAASASRAGADIAITPTAFGLRMTVSGGTYVRSIVHDLSHAVGSAGHVVTLKRSVQGKFALDPPQEDPSIKGCVPWEVFERALADVGPRDQDGWTEWEREVLDKLEIVDDVNDK